MSDIPLEQYRKKSQTDSVNQQERANSQVIFQALFQLMLEQGYEQANFQKIATSTRHGHHACDDNAQPVQCVCE